MEWWQIVLICFMAIVIGVSIGLGVDYLIRQYRRKRAPALAAAREGGQVVPPVKGEEKKPSATMVPFLGRRSLIGLSIGLAIGAALGLGYWAASPLNLTVRAGWPPIQFAHSQPTLYESVVYVQVVNQGTSAPDLDTLRRQTEYYVAKMQTLPFFDFVSQKIAKQAPQYFHTANDLTKATAIDVQYEGDIANIRVRVKSQNPQEAFYLASTTGQSFQEYLQMEELNLQEEAYQSKVSEIESTKTALLEAEKEVAQIVAQEEGNFDLTTDAQYIALNARIESLQRELTKATDNMTALIAQGDSGAAYTQAAQAVERASEALGGARQEVTRLKAQYAVKYFQEQLAYTEANTEVDTLSKQLNDLVASLGSEPSSNPEPTETSYFRLVSEPSTPVLVPEERIKGRSATIMGALFGLGVAWVVLNRRWLIKEVSSPRQENKESTT